MTAKYYIDESYDDLTSKIIELPAIPTRGDMVSFGDASYFVKNVEYHIVDEVSMKVDITINLY